MTSNKEDIIKSMNNCSCFVQAYMTCNGSKTWQKQNPYTHKFYYISMPMFSDTWQLPINKNSVHHM